MRTLLCQSMSLPIFGREKKVLPVQGLRIGCSFRASKWIVLDQREVRQTCELCDFAQ